MKKIFGVKKASVLLISLFLQIGCTGSDKTASIDLETLKSGFITPSPDNTLWCYWYWIGDDISREGITKDLEAMKQAGIGGAFIGNINPEEKDGKVPILSEEWWEHMVHAINEGKRIGVDIGVFNSPGWSQSGGPWVNSQMAMRHMVYSETILSGEGQIEIELPQPADEFQDTYVLAFPSSELKHKSAHTGNARISITPQVENAHKLIDKDTTTVTEFSKADYVIDIHMEDYMDARSIKFQPTKKPIYISCEVSVLIDGEYKPIKSFVIDRIRLTPNVGPNLYAPFAIALPETRAKDYRLKFQYLGAGWGMPDDEVSRKEKWGFSEITISESAQLEYFSEKNLGKMHTTPLPSWDSYQWETQEAVANELSISTASILDISHKMDSNGKLSWVVPAGDWVVQRYGMTPTGTKNHPAAPQGVGYEVDKANKELVRFHYNQFIGELLKRVPEESKSAFKYVIADSYEMGSQNWTDGYEEKFESEFGYNPKKYLPVFSGRIVGSVEESNRFLWDLRRSIANAVAYEYTGEMRNASNGDNLKLWLENYGHWGFPSEFLMYGGQSDLVSGEFWNEGTLGDIECKSASAAAHIYGKPIVSAEAFTASSRTFVRHPTHLKKRGDWSFTEGINHLVLHVYIHQPDEERVPGVNAWFGTEFNRHNTWFEKAKTYFDYLRRSQHLLQQGKYVADVCYFIGEDVPIMTGTRNPELPTGYSYDYINAEVILNRLSVRDGKFVLPDGMTYKLMVLPDLKTMRPELLEKIEALVKQGGKIYGEAPITSPSLQNYPEADKKVKEMAERMWNGTQKGINPYGSGHIVRDIPLHTALQDLNINIDLDIKGETDVLWTHRTLPGVEIYFLTNQSEETKSFAPSFRVNGMQPQLWDAETGEIRPLSEYKEENGRITVPIKMDALQSWFVIFSKPDKSQIGESYKTNFPPISVIETIKEPWAVDFKDKKIGPAHSVEFPTLMEWVENKDDKIKYYSGTAVYKTTFNFEDLDHNKELFINLGNVGVMASVKLNGQDLGTTWIAPYRLKINNALRSGENTLEVEVVNVWRNRITGDRTIPENDRSTWLIFDAVTPDEELVPSGLMGPVTIEYLNKN